MNEGTVYLPQEPVVKYTAGKFHSKDLSSAHKYGKVVPILGGHESASLAPDHSLRRITEALKDFNAETDYLCMAGGDFLSLGLALIALKNMQIKSIQLLRWDRQPGDSDGRKGHYIPVIVPLG